MTINLISPFPVSHYHLLWGWLNEYRDRNFDDAGPRCVAELAADVDDREKRGERVWEVLSEGVPVGVIGYVQKTPDHGHFHGICFTKLTHGTGVALRAVSKVLADAFEIGTETVDAAYFNDNERIRGLFKKLGAEEGQLIYSKTLRSGKPVQWRLTRIGKDEFLAQQGLLRCEEAANRAASVLWSA